MKARGLLMIEHRLIEKTIVLAKRKLSEFNEDNFDPVLLDNIIDFIRTYADKTHHGKEEDILFKRLEGKSLNKADAELMQHLADEHKQTRKKVKELISLNNDFKSGNKSVTEDIKKIVNWLSELYPEHIQKEDVSFFPNADKYFSDTELDELLNEYYLFDARMIHEKYLSLYNSLKD